MNFLLDDIARTLATPMPRRQALKIVGKTLAGVVAAATIGARRGQAASCKGANQFSCANDCCNSTTEQCCHVTGQGLQKYCAPKNNICCGGTSCPSGQCCDKKNKCQASLTACH